MKSDLALLNIRKVIIHEVPKRARDTGPGGPILSEVESQIDSDLVVYIKKRVISSLKSSQAFDIVFDPTSTSPVPKLVLEHTAEGGKGNFVLASQQMAQHLYNIQTGTNPAGLLTVIDCSINGLEALGILKLEKEEGARIAQGLVGGKRTYDIKVLRDLILTEKTKVFKIGLFVQLGASLDSYDAAASDHQRGLYHRTEVADFFLKRFLGCRLTEEPEVSTKRFFEIAEEFLNEHVDDPLRRVKYHNHLVSELTSETGAVAPKAFAQKFLVTADRQRFLDYLKDKSGPVGSFSLDTSLIKTRLEKEVYEFQSGVSIVAPIEPGRARLKLTKLESGEVQAEVRDFLTEVRGKR